MGGAEDAVEGEAGAKARTGRRTKIQQKIAERRAELRAVVGEAKAATTTTNKCATRPTRRITQASWAISYLI